MDIEELQSVAGQRYDVEGFLAEGGMGAVYTARHRSLGSRVAIKVLPPEVASSAVRLARFKREAELAANLSHPNIVPVFEFDATPQLAYLVMPYVQGETLGDKLSKEGKLEYSDVRRMLGQVASALSFAHARGVVHRDIKPSNILREEAAGRWLITDFGIAHVTDPSDTEITQTGTIIGTPAYMAPEQRWGGHVDGRSDLFSLAAVIYQAICGTPTDQLPDELLKERTELERSIRSAQPKIKSEVARLLTWPLETAKDDRPETAEAWLKALDQAEGTNLRVRWAWASGIAAVLIAVGLLIFGGRGAPDATATREVTNVAILPFTGLVQGDTGGVTTQLPQLLDLQLQYLPEEYSVLSEWETDVQSVTGWLNLARARNASLALIGQVDGTSSDLRIAIQVHDVIRGGPPKTLRSSGSVDNLTQLMADLVVQFMDDQGIDRMGFEQGLLRNLDPEVAQSYWNGERDLSEGRYTRAVEQFEEAIASDSTFALAYFKRMVAMLFATRPSEYSTVVGTALEAAIAYRDRLPPLSQRLLQAYEILLLRGDIDSAVSLARELAENRPQPDTYSLLGYVIFNFRALLGETPEAAAYYFRQAVELDSSYALALWHLAVIEMREGNRAAAQDYIDRLLDVDSTSIWAQVVALGDSVLFTTGLANLNLPRSYRNMSPGALELMIVPLGEMEAPPGLVPASREALRVFWERAQTDYDRRLAFRMRMAQRLARGRFAGADSLINEGRRAGVPTDEIDRWIVLSAITPLPPLATTAEQSAAARRLEDSGGNAEAAWLVARWYLAEEPSLAESRIQRLQSITQSSVTTSPLPRSLDLDVQAKRALTTGDTSAALRLWDEATQRYSVVDDFLFGLTASLWPLRWSQIQVLAASGRPADAEQALEIADTFEQMFGFVDQVAWPEVLLLEMDAALTLEDRPKSTRAQGLLEDVLVRDRFSPAARELRSRARRKLEPQGN
jgi:tetratricopeptide (TPR) repeat protein